MPEPLTLSRRLVSALPDSVILPDAADAFKQATNVYWAQQEREAVPTCVVQPKTVEQLCTAVRILKEEYDELAARGNNGNNKGLFAIRSGGYSPVPGAASVGGGALIDLSRFDDVTPSADGSTVAIGAGARWSGVSKILDEKGLAVAGCRNSAVGVGGMILGGGLSFFSPRFGFVCSNILSYDIVLASGTATVASESTNPDLWRALKGGSNNFGIVTRFTAYCFPSTKIWSGFLYLSASQTAEVLAAFQECVNRADSTMSSTTSDNYAAGPIACFTYIPKIGLQVISVHLAYTKPIGNGRKWPDYWQNSPFGSFWCFWRTCKERRISSANDEVAGLNPAGRRQVFATTTIQNDYATLEAAHAGYRDAIASLRHAKVEGLVWTLVLQPLVPDWARKGDENPLGLHDCASTLVVVSFTVNWDRQRDDEFVKAKTRDAIEKIEAAAVAHNTSHPYRYLNYRAHWQKPFEGYGEKNWRFLQDVSRKYDPDGLLQKGCVGGFKLGLPDSKD